MTKQSPLERYVRALEEIAANNEGGINLSDLARQCRLPAPTAYRIIQGLIKTGLVVPREGSKSYVLGSRLIRLLHTGTDDAWLKAVSQPILDRLSDRLHETAYLAQLRGGSIVSVSWAVPESGLRTKVYPGDVMPPHAAASAKAILAHQPEEVVAQVLGGERERYTPHTKTDLASIQRTYVRIRREGYATCWNEMELGLGALACPIHVEGLGTQYAIAVTGLAARLRKHPPAKIVELLRSAAKDLKRAIEAGSHQASAAERIRSATRPSARRILPQQRGLNRKAKVA
jgi:DNA-binding IclR family transcriptional regulator